MLWQIVYVSGAAPGLWRGDIDAILESARRNNKGRGITGLMLSLDDAFFQLLEGEEEAVKRLYEVIARDPRHTACTKLLSRRVERRLFPSWSMGYDRLDPEETDETVFSVTRQFVEDKLNAFDDTAIDVLMNTFLKVAGADRYVA